MTDTNTGDTSRLSNLVSEVKQAVTEIKSAVEPKLAELGQEIQQRVQQLGQTIDQKLDELAAAFGPSPNQDLPNQQDQPPDQTGQAPPQPPS